MAYYDSVDSIKQLVREGQIDEAISALICMLPEIERDGRKYGQVAPWYYNELAMLYRKKKDLDAEIAILKRYIKVNKGSYDKIDNQLKKAEEKKQSTSPIKKPSKSAKVIHIEEKKTFIEDVQE